MSPRSDTIMPAARFRRLGLEVTRQCNSHCVYCFAGAQTDGAETMPLHAARGIVFEGYRAHYRHLHITGGEPLLYDGLFELLDAAADLDYASILLNTNGILLDRRMCRRLQAYPRLTLTVSLEGTPGLHDRFRGAGSHPRVSRGLENGLAAGLDIVVFTIAFKSLLPGLPRLAEHLMSRFPGISYLTLIRLVAAGRSPSPLEDEYLTPEDFLELARTAALINLHGLRTVILNEPLTNVVSKALGLRWMPKSTALCREGNLMVRADGRIALSHAGPHEFGTYKPGVLGRILAGQAYKSAVAPDNQVCPACTYRKLCRDGDLIRPAEWHMTGPMPVHYCQSVLDLIAV